MKKILFPSLILGAVLFLGGCISPVGRYARQLEKRMQYNDRLLASRGTRAANTVIQSYSRILKTMPGAPGLTSLKRRILTKRGQAYVLIGDKKRAETDFSAARTVRSRAPRSATPAPPTAWTSSPPRPTPSAAAPKPAAKVQKAKKKRLFSASLDLWGGIMTNWRVLRDSPTVSGTTIHPNDDLGCGSILISAALRSRFHIFPRLSAGLDLSFGSMDGETTIDELHRYDGRVLPMGETVSTEASFFEVTGTVRYALSKLPLPGNISLEAGVKYVSFTLDFTMPNGTGFTDTIDAFFPLLGLHWSKNLGNRLNLLLDCRLCGLYFDGDNFSVSTMYFEIFGGGELTLAPHVHLLGGVRYAYATYVLHRHDQDKRLDYTKIGPTLALNIRF